jgi:dCMP deaminase
MFTKYFHFLAMQYFVLQLHAGARDARMPLDNLPSFDSDLLSGFAEDQKKRKKSSYVHDAERLLKWDKLYTELAAHVASWSKDPSAKVGCVIVNPKYGRAVTFSFNGFPADVTDNPELLQHKNDKLDRILHAEQNALLYAGREAKGCHAYVVGKPVCNTCAIMLIQAGIRRVVAAPPLPEGGGKWDERGRLALKLFKQTGVEFRPIEATMNKALIEEYGLWKQCACCC